MTTEVINTGQPQDNTAAGPKDAELAAKFDKKNEGTGEPVGDKPQRPEWVPEKFWDAEKGEVMSEAMAKSYAELEKKNSGTKDEKKDGSKDTSQAPVETPEDAAKALEKAGLKFDEFDAEYQKDGKLSDDSYKKLEAAGIPKDVVDNYVAGQSARAQAIVTDAYSAAGGEDNFKAIAKWAEGGADEALLATYNELVASGDAAKIKSAVVMLKGAYEASEGSAAARTIKGGGGETGDVYESVEQVKSDMRDPRYKKDSAFRDKVAQKIARSNVM